MENHQKKLFTWLIIQKTYKKKRNKKQLKTTTVWKTFVLLQQAKQES